MDSPAAPRSPLLTLGLPALGGLAVGLAGALVIGFLLVPGSASSAAGGPAAEGTAPPEVTPERLASIEFTAEDLTRMIWDDGDNEGRLLPDPDPTHRKPATYGAPTAADVIAGEAGEFTKVLTPECIVVDKGAAPVTGPGTADDAYFERTYWDEIWPTAYPTQALAVETGRAYPSVEAAEAAMAELRGMLAACGEYQHEYGEVTDGLRYTRVGTVTLTELPFPVAVPEPIEAFAFERRWPGEAAATEHYVMRIGNTVVGVDYRPWFPASGGNPSAEQVQQRQALVPAMLQEQLDRMLWWAGYAIEAGAA